MQEGKRGHVYNGNFVHGLREGLVFISQTNLFLLSFLYLYLIQ
jgi:hypothetical protein